MSAGSCMGWDGNVGSNHAGKFSQFRDLREFGADGTVSNDLAAMEKAITEVEGQTLYIPKGTWWIAGHVFDGHEGTRIICVGTLKVNARHPSVPLFSNAYIGLVFKGCEDIDVKIRANGNRINQTDQQHNHIIGVAGCKRSKFKLIAKEMRGDAVYVGQSDFLSASGQSEDLKFAIHAENSVSDGRNALTVASGERIKAQVKSINVGGYVEGLYMPGGVDIEPNHTFQSCRHIDVGVVAIGDGTGFSAAHGHFGEDLISDITAKVDIITKSKTRRGVLTRGVRDSSVSGFVRHDYSGETLPFVGATRSGIYMDECDNVNVDLDTHGFQIGASIGPVNEVKNSDINVRVRDFIGEGFVIGKASNCTIRGSVTDPMPVTVAVGNKFAVRLRSPGNGLQKNIRYKISVPYNPILTKGIRREPDIVSPPTPLEPVFDNVSITACDLTGWADPDSQLDGDFSSVVIDALGVSAKTQEQTTPNAGSVDLTGLGFRVAQGHSVYSVSLAGYTATTDVTEFTGNLAKNDTLEVRMSTYVTLKNDSGKIRLRDGLDATANANGFITFKRSSGIWYETSRSF